MSTSSPEPQSDLVPLIDGARNANEHLLTYLRRDLAHLHGIDRDWLAALDARPRAEWSLDQRRWEREAQAVLVAFGDWIANNAPEALAPLRETGLLIALGRCEPDPPAHHHPEETP